MASAAYKKATRRTGKAWSGADIMRLQRMADKQIPAEQIARRLSRTEGAVRTEAARHNIMLAPRQRTLTGKLPYGGMTVDARRPASRPAKNSTNRNLNSSTARRRPASTATAAPQAESLF
jgi:hypothetical protein